MPHYHLTVKPISRKTGKSCVSALAYRSASNIVDLNTGEVFDYRSKKFVETVEILVPENAPSWIKEIAKECQTNRQSALQKLSDVFEAAEKRKDARVYREIEFSLPRELTKDQNIEWAKKFIPDTCTSRGMVAITCFHFDIDEKTDEFKPHCHVLLSTRELTETGFSVYKNRDWDKVDLVNEWREEYANHQNAALAEHGFDCRVDHRSYVDQGLREVDPQPKKGKIIDELTDRGIVTDKHKTFDLVRLKNQFKILKNPELVFSIVTSHHSTFTEQDIAKVLHRYIDNIEQFNNLHTRLMASPQLVSLETNPDKPKTAPVFTTREILKIEMDMVNKAEKMSAEQTHRVKEKVIEKVLASQNEELKKHGGLSADQTRAIRHMLNANQISVVVGYAGAGKTTSLKAAKEAWEQSGYKVLGIAPTGRAAENMAKCGIRSMTIHKFLWAQKGGRERLSKKTVLIIDEAGMVDSRRSAEIIDIAKQSGAKVVPMGDGNQLPSVEAGPAYRLLTDRVKPVVLETIVRQQVEWQREATKLFGSLETRKALELYQDHGAFKVIKEASTNAQTMVKKYCLARQISGRIWREMEEDLGLKNAKQADLKEHQDFGLYEIWKETRQKSLEVIVKRFDNHEAELKEKGINLRPLMEEWQQAHGTEKTEAFDKIENAMRKMSYDNLVDTRVETKNALVNAWAQDRAKTPSKSHLMLAYTNKDACSLNESARAIMRAQGVLTGKDFIFQTLQIQKDDFGNETITVGNKAFAKGDRLLFMRNDNSLKVRNGSLGEVVEITKNRIKVLLDDSEGRTVSFAPKLYPFIDNGWATNIHKAQGVTVDHVKKLGSFEEYRNLAYVGMTRHRKSLEVFVSDLDFWREEKIIDRLSRVQEKLSGVDYLKPDQINERLKEDAKILWHEKKIQQGKDLWNAVKVTARSAVGQIFSNSDSKTSSVNSVLDLNDSEEKRSSEMFKFREALPKERAAFEDRQRDKYRDACEFFEFKGRFGRYPTVEDKGTVQLMGEELTRLAGRLFQEKALADGILPKPSDITKLAYKEFALRPSIENSMAEQMAVEHSLSAPTAQIMANLIITQEDISGQKLTKSDEAKCLDMAKFAEGRIKELTQENNSTNAINSDKNNSTPDKYHQTEQSTVLTTYRLTRELTQMQLHQNRHGTLPIGETLTKIQENARLETQKLSEKILIEQTTKLQRDRNMRQGLRM